MTRANSVSPFAAEQSDLLWTTWQKTTPVTALLEKPTESRSNAAEQTAETAPVPEAERETFPALFPEIQRSRYDAVMARMKNASRGATAFSAWPT